MKNSLFLKSFLTVAIIVGGFFVVAQPAFAQSYNWSLPQWLPGGYGQSSYGSSGSGYNPYAPYQYQSNPYQSYLYGWNLQQLYQNKNWAQPTSTSCSYHYGCNSSGAFSISNISGPTQLQVGQPGTWSVQADDSSGYLSYSVIWGDEQNYAVPTNASAGQQMQSTGTLTHMYQTAGTYSPRFTVTNAYGQSQSASATVVVSGNGGGGCTGPDCNVNFTASPTSGQAPLAVVFTATFGASASGDYLVDFGDGQTGIPGGTVGCPAVVGVTCRDTRSVSHAYAQAGTYTARLTLRGVEPAPVLGTVTVTVTSNQTNTTFSASPQSGIAPLTVSFCSATPGTLDFGDGASGKMSAVGLITNCGGRYIATHTYTSPGTYTATLSKITVCPAWTRCLSQVQVVGTATITVTGGSQTSGFWEGSQSYPSYFQYAIPFSYPSYTTPPMQIGW